MFTTGFIYHIFIVFFTLPCIIGKTIIPELRQNSGFECLQCQLEMKEPSAFQGSHDISPKKFDYKNPLIYTTNRFKRNSRLQDLIFQNEINDNPYLITASFPYQNDGRTYLTSSDFDDNQNFADYAENPEFYTQDYIDYDVVESNNEYTNPSRNDDASEINSSAASRNYDLLMNHVSQIQAQHPMISAAIASASVRSSKNGSESHVLGSAVNGGYFSARAGGSDGKGRSLDSRIDGTAERVKGESKAHSPDMKSDVFIQVDHSEQGLTLGQSSTSKGKAEVAAGLDRDTKYNHQLGDITSSYNDQYDTKIFGHTFGEANSKLLPINNEKDSLNSDMYQNSYYEGQILEEKQNLSTYLQNTEFETTSPIPIIYSDLPSYNKLFEHQNSIINKYENTHKTENIEEITDGAKKTNLNTVLNSNNHPEVQENLFQQHSDDYDYRAYKDYNSVLQEQSIPFNTLVNDLSDLTFPQDNVVLPIAQFLTDASQLNETSNSQLSLHSNSTIEKPNTHQYEDVSYTQRQSHKSLINHTEKDFINHNTNMSLHVNRKVPNVTENTSHNDFNAHIDSNIIDNKDIKLPAVNNRNVYTKQSSSPVSQTTLHRNLPEDVNSFSLRPQDFQISNSADSKILPSENIDQGIMSNVNKIVKPDASISNYDSNRALNKGMNYPIDSLGYDHTPFSHSNYNTNKDKIYDAISTNSFGLQNGFYPPNGAIFNPGEAVPGIPGYRIPQGFRGRVVHSNILPLLSDHTNILNYNNYLRQAAENQQRNINHRGFQSQFRTFYQNLDSMPYNAKWQYSQPISSANPIKPQFGPNYMQYVAPKTQVHHPKQRRTVTRKMWYSNSPSFTQTRRTSTKNCGQLLRYC